MLSVNRRPLTLLVGPYLLILGFVVSFLPKIDWYRNKIQFFPSEYVGKGLTERMAQIFFKWDAIWYSKLAVNGYSKQDPLGLAFFPGFPTLLSLFRPLVGNEPQNLALVGIGINLLLWTMALFIWNLVLDEVPYFANRGRKWFPWIFVLFPSTLFNVIAYTETLFIVAAGASIYFALKNRPWPLFFSMGLLVLSKHVGITTGFFLLLWIALYRRKLFPQAILGYGLLVGAILILSYEVTGDPMAWAHVQSAWKRHFGWPHEIFLDLVGKGGIEMIFYALFLFLGPVFLFLRILRPENRSAENLIVIFFTTGVFLPVWFGGSAAVLYRILYLVPFLWAWVAGWIEKKSRVSQKAFAALLLLMNAHLVYRFVAGMQVP